VSEGAGDSVKQDQGDWLNLDDIAQVEISSEDAHFPIENALGKAVTTGWRAAEKGPQVIRLQFDAPQTIRRIQLHFVERSGERSQEFAVFAGAGSELRDVVRQQWSFSPHGATEEIENYTVDLTGITTLELRIDPDRSHDPKQSQAYASLQSLKLA
jgi:XRCC1 N terminal domain